MVRRSILFLLPIILIGISVELLLRSIPNDLSFKHRAILEEGREWDFIILGNSHSLYGVDPALLPGNGFNLSNISQDLSIDRMLLEKYSSNLTGLKRIYICMSYGRLGGKLKDGVEAWRAKNYIIYMDLPLRSVHLAHHLEIFNRPMKSNIWMIWDYFQKGKTNITCDENGSGSTAPERKPLDISGAIAAKRHTTDPELELHGIKELDKILEWSRQRAIEVHMFIPPAWSSYHRSIDPKQLQRLRHVCSLRSNADTSVYFHDLLHSPSFQQEDFDDADHLSRSGQIKLSRILSDPSQY